MKIRPTRTAGFTLVEIMVVVGIIGLLTPIAIPNYLKARAASQTSTCLNNIRQIDAAKQQWATETNQGLSATPDATDLAPYIGRPGSINACHCPLDPRASFETSYTVGDVSEAPSCNFSPEDHSL